MKKLLIILLAPLLPKIALAAPTGGTGGGIGPPPPTGCSSFLSCISTIQNPATSIANQKGLIGTLINLVFPLVLGVAGFLTVIIIIFSGIQFITSSGNPDAAGAARSRLIYALIGFVIIVLAFAILTIIDNIFLGNSGIV